MKQSFLDDFINIFPKYGNENKIEVSCHASSQGAFFVNYSSILSRLIQEAGRFCESNSSDLFSEWEQIACELDNGSIHTKTVLLGFKEDGVDHTEFMLSRFKWNTNYYACYYRSVWRLDVVREENFLTMTLYRVSVPGEKVIKDFFFHYC